VPELRRLLEAELPEPMVPSAIVLLDHLPLTPNGKVDRAALPAPESLGEAAETFVAPSSPLEELVAQVTMEVLGIERAGMRDNFFALGGHSLLATQLVSRLAQQHGLPLTLQTVFDAADLGELAGALAAAADSDRAREASAWADAPADLPAAPAPAGTTPEMGRAPRDQPLPLSFAQERLWFLDRLAPGTAAYNIPLALAAHGELSPAALEAALGEMVRRHEALRTRFAAALPGDGTAGPRQIIAPARPWRLPLADLAALPAAVRDVEARRLADAEVSRGFDLVSGPVLRSLVLHLAKAEHVLLLVVHHIAGDGWSVGVMVNEIMALYTAALEQRPSPLAELALQYADFAVWQRQWLRGPALDRQLDYWRGKLAGASRLALPADRQRPPVPTFRGATRRHAMQPAAARAAEELARRGNATLFMVMLAAFQALLGRYSGQDDVVVGSPIANRNRAEIEPLAGFFVNSLVLRGDLAGDPSYHELLIRTRRTTLEAYAHQDLPFERLVEELRPERRLTENPLFQVMCAVQNAPLRAIELPALRFSPVELNLTATRFDLEIHFIQPDAEPSPGNAAPLTVQLTYSTELFDAPTMIRMLRHLETLLRGAAADPAQRLSRLPLLAAGERHQVLREWNDTRAAAPRQEVAALFFAQARRRPAAVALRTEGGAVTYGELAGRAVRLALRLAAVGVGPEVRVGLLARRSAAAIEGILGILAAGGAYVPLDPGHPAERLAFLLADSRASVLLSTRELAERLPAGLVHGLAGLDGPLLWVDLAPAPARGGVEPEPVTESPESSESLEPAEPSGRSRPSEPSGLPGSSEPAGPLRAGDAQGEDWAGWWEGWSAGRRPGPEGLAYVMYTSGSTGGPKGVGIPQRGIVRLVRGGGFARMDDGEVFLLLAPLAFDASTLEIWGPLLNGGTLALLPAASERRPSIGDIGAAVARFAVSTLWLTAGLFHQMVDEELAALAPLGQLLSGGDVLSPPHVRRALAGLPGVALINGYGPTEATTFTACQTLRDAAEVGASVALGRPIGNTRVHILDGFREAVPAGLWGELWVGGEGLARGYLGRPEATAESFAPDPFAAGGDGAGGERLYRTGDVARRLADGRLEFRRRRDGQVKLRGFRIELGEIEGALARHPQVAAAAAALIALPDPGRDRAGGGALDQRLVAYVVLRGPNAAGGSGVPVGAAARGGAPAGGAALDGVTIGAVAGDGAPAAARYLAQWRELYEQTYAPGPPPAAAGDGSFNIQGWNSSYTGEPIPPAEMREWVETTVARIARLGRRRILEVGCGTGLLLLRLAPGAERYRGTDFSAVALAGLRQELERPERGLGAVELAEAAADDWSAVTPGDFDLVVLNSVIQYFPGADYLLGVLRKAVAALAADSAPGGTIFLGDVRSLPLLEAFHLSVEMHRAAGSLAVSELVRRVRRRVAEEEELALDPAFFLALQRHLPGIRRVRLTLHRGRHANELTRFRYDVVLEVGAAPGAGVSAPPGTAAPALHWATDHLDLEALERRLASLPSGPQPVQNAAAAASPEAGAPPATLVVGGIPSARLATEAAVLEILAAGEAPATVADLRAETDRRLSARAADRASRPQEPETLWRLADRLGYDLDLAWPTASGGVDGHLEALFRRRPAAGAGGDESGVSAGGCIESGVSVGGSAQSGVSLGGDRNGVGYGDTSGVSLGGATAPPSASGRQSEGDANDAAWASGPPADGAGATPWWSSWANDPLRAAAQRHLVPELRRLLEAELPEPMVPAAIVVLPALPLTANGKVDRAALPVPESLGQAAATFVAASSPLEELLAKATAELLGIERAGMRDNFFALGGHSLLATQLVSRLAQQHALPVTLQMVFDAADLGELADLIVQREIEGADGALLEEALRSLDAAP
jgi:amino acid adenylation domain-containing protein